MNAKVPPGHLSRPLPWLTAAILLFIAAAAMLAGGARHASAAHAYTAAIPPSSTTSAGAGCTNTAPADQVLGGDWARCNPNGGMVVYEFFPVGIPANATNITWSVGLWARALGADATMYLLVGDQAAHAMHMPVPTANTHRDAHDKTWGKTWGPNEKVRLTIGWEAGGAVEWDDLHVYAGYDVPDAADLSLNVTGPQTVLQGQTITYTVHITNNGPQDSTGSVLTTNLPAGVVHLNTTGCISGAVPTCNIGHMVPGGGRTVTINALASLGALGFRTANFSVAAGNQADNDMSDNTDSVTTTILPRRNYTVCKEWVDNNDGVLEPARTFTVLIHRESGGEPIQENLHVSEGNSICRAGATNLEPLTVEEVQDPGFENAPGYPRWQVGTDEGQVMGPVDLPVGEDKITFFNRVAAGSAPPPPGTGKYIRVCKFLMGNFDTVEDGGTFTFEFRVAGSQTPFTTLSFTIAESNSGCGEVYPEAFGIDTTSMFEVEEVGFPAGWQDAAGFPQHYNTNQLVYSAKAEFTIPSGSSAKYLTFYNQRQYRHELEICKDLEDNNDGIVDDGTWTFEVYEEGSLAPFTTVSLAADEGALDINCDRLAVEDYGITLPAKIEVRELPKAGFVDAPGYPFWTKLDNVPQAGPALVEFTDPDQYQERHVVFHNKAAEPAPSSTPSPTTTPDPTSTPAPTEDDPAPDPTPSSTNPPAGGDDEPETPSTTPVGDGGAPGGPADEPAGNGPDDTPGQTGPVTEPQVPATGDDTTGGAEAQPTPVAPSTGSSFQAAGGGRNLMAPLVLLGMAAMSAAMGLARIVRREEEVHSA